jgi:hypothetical protein
MKVIDNRGAICVRDKPDEKPIPIERLQYLARSGRIMAKSALVLGLAMALPVINADKKMRDRTSTGKEQFFGGAEMVVSIDSAYFAAFFFAKSRKAANLLRRNDVCSE